MKFTKDILIYCALIAVAIITHLQWFNFNNVLTYSDWHYWPNRAVEDLWYSWGAWINYYNLGATNLQLSFLPFKLVWSAFAHLGFTYDDATKVTFFIPIAIASILCPYILLNKITQNKTTSFVVALAYSSSPYFLVRQTGHIPLALAFAIAPIILYFFIVALEKETLKSWLVFSVSFSIAILYEVRLAFIMTFIFSIFYVVYCAYKKTIYVKYLLYSLGIIFALNVYWILPTFTSGNVEELERISNRDLFGEFLFDIQHAITSVDSSWTGTKPNIEFQKQIVLPFYWITPILIIVAVFYVLRNKHKDHLLTFFTIISLAGILLTKQSQIPFPYIYKWLYEYLPGFSIYREASKFYLLTGLGYIGILGIGLNFLSQNKHNNAKGIYYFILMTISIISFVNYRPLIWGEMGSLFTNRTIPDDYIKLQEYVSQDDEFYRTIWFPVDSRWAYYSNIHPKVNALAGLSEFYKLNVTDKFTSREKIDTLSNYYLDASSIKYLIIPVSDKENDDDFFRFYEDRERYLEIVNNLRYLKPINIGAEELLVYENTDYAPHIFLSSEKVSFNNQILREHVTYQFLSPSEYQVTLKNLPKTFYLNFSESYNKNWEIRHKRFMISEILAGNKNTVYTSHELTDSSTNSFYINQSELCKLNSCTMNADGTYNTQIYIFFNPQKYFLLGGLISLFTLTSVTILFIVSYLPFNYLKKSGKL